MGRKRTAVEEFDPQRVRPLAGQPRKRFKGINELAASIAEIGQSCPGIVTLVAGDARYDAQLVDGERRLRACRQAGVPFRAEVRPDATAEEIFVASFGANFGKQDHDVMEIAEGLDRMRRAGKTVEQLGRIAGKSASWVVSHLNLLKLHPDVQAMMVTDADDEDDDARPKVTFSIAQLLVSVEPPAAQVALARRITKGDGMGMAAARRFILRERSEAGDAKAYSGSRGHQRAIGTIESITEDVTERIGVYLDMPGPEINRLIDATDMRTKRLVVQSLRDAQENLAALAERIEERLPALNRRTA